MVFSAHIQGLSRQTRQITMSNELKTLGIDTSNYTCSAAVFYSETGKVYQSKQLLPVKKGEKGIRQSDAVFHHTVLLPQRQLPQPVLLPQQELLPRLLPRE